MHDIEPFFQWRHLYKSEEDPKSPFYQKRYDEFSFQHAVYNYVIHPQWDSFGSSTLYVKILYVDYRRHFLVAECIGEWNDTLHQDFLQLWNEILGVFFDAGINYFVLVGESIFNFHQGDKNDYEELSAIWRERDGWVCFVNIYPVAMQECKEKKMHKYFHFLQLENWRTIAPQYVKKAIQMKLNNHITLV